MRLFSLLFVFLLIVSCSEQKQTKITDAADYEAFLFAEAPQTTSKYFELWNSKIKPDSMQLQSFGIVAGEYSRFFEATGDILFLKKAEQALKRAADIAAIGKAGYLRALGRNYISQHRFREALVLANEAENLGSGLRQTKGLLFDIHMELGNYDQAEEYLRDIEDMGRIDYLIRLSKWHDHQGDLPAAIFNLEIATKRAEESKNPQLMQWCYSNLADYYGHAGRLQDSYQHYLKTLELDPTNAYAKKGIAWIVFSHERRPKEALRMLKAIGRTYNSPDLWLFRSEIAAYMGDKGEEARSLDNYLRLVTNTEYGQMYNGPMVDFYLDVTRQTKRAVQLAEQEVTNRRTPETVALLAYAYYKDGQSGRALQLIEEAVTGKTYEPKPLLYAVEIYKSFGKTDEVQNIKADLVEAVYELGPNSEQILGKL
ncbi:tetratricopeptide repeat protein [Robiginitalea sp. IMCC43444]|uniref:tetratricopeptide repeat protein n=1 Tax=Robiginitalea sp. IMCC43444 TaxID=3459121 RepID=UPI0040416BD5